ncbi:MAG: glycosyltransferase family 2 protein [Deltaproteobacteria bacterium]|nr:glycosyltransferase family 2 protein [Deltaproteobacteria bacterium]
MEVSVLIPVRNEEANLDELIRRLRSLPDLLPSPFEVIAVDDASTDRSPEILAGAALETPFLRVLRQTSRRGMGGALMAGAREARGRFVFWTMADYSDDFSDLPAMLDRLRGGADLVVASRAVPGGGYGDLGRFKSFLSHLFSRAARALFRLPIHDVTNAFRGMRREVLDGVRLRRTDFSISPEQIIEAHRAGARIEEVPTTYSFRRGGASHFRVVRMGWSYGLLLFRRLGNGR